MLIGERLKAFREMKKMSQADLEKRTRLMRVYISRVENGHVVPSVDTLEKFARALEVPLYQFFCDGQKPHALQLPNGPGRGCDSSGRNARIVDKFRRLFARASESDRKLVLLVAQKMSQRRRDPRRRIP